MHDNCRSSKYINSNMQVHGGSQVMRGFSWTHLDLSCRQTHQPPQTWQPSCVQPSHTKNSIKYQYSELWANQPDCIHPAELQGIRLACQRDGECTNQQLQRILIITSLQGTTALFSCYCSTCSHGLNWNRYWKCWLRSFLHELAIQKQKMVLFFFFPYVRDNSKPICVYSLENAFNPSIWLKQNMYLQHITCSVFLGTSNK